MKNKLIEFISHYLSDDSSGHDVEHALRVYNNAQLILQSENLDYIDQMVINTACIVHDLIDDKICSNIEERKQNLISFLDDFLTINQIEAVLDIIEHISFSKNIENPYQLSIEGQIVQDADRLDALGAIGIARTFAYGGHKHRKIYDHNINIAGDLINKDYRDNNNTSINHFYEKLLKLPALMNTEYAKKLAEQRCEFINLYLNEFFDEINGKK